jgi:hypothetical protein
MTDDLNPEEHWDELRRRMEAGGPRDVARYITDFAPEERKKLYSFAQKAFAQRDWAGKSFEGLIEVVRTGMDDAQTMANRSTDPEQAWKWTEHANILAFNLSADLCDCWPGERGSPPRERHHFETGLRLAEDCVRWRRELGKPPERRALAYWAVGMHHLSLGQPHEALGAFVAAAGLAAADRKAAGLPHTVEPGGDFAVVLYHGYTAIAGIVLGEAGGREQLERALHAFKETVARFPDKKEDAQFGLDQLRLVERKYASSSTSSTAS